MFLALLKTSFPPVPHIQVGGQCQCKVAVTGRQCTDCLPGWYGLKASNSTGCIHCNCSDIGIISNSTGGVSSCNQDTGQCQCKPHVTGEHWDKKLYVFYLITYAIVDALLQTALHLLK